MGLKSGGSLRYPHSIYIQTLEEGYYNYNIELMLKHCLKKPNVYQYITFKCTVIYVVCINTILINVLNFIMTYFKGVKIFISMLRVMLICGMFRWLN